MRRAQYPLNFELPAYERAGTLKGISMYEIDVNKAKEIVASIVAEHAIKNVAFVGCGASMSELYPAKYFLANNTKTLNVQIFTANEFNYDTPAWVSDDTIVITCSLGGSTPETVAANGTAKAKGATVVAVTHNPNAALIEKADYSIVHGFEANYAAKCEKLGYVIDLAVEILQQVEGTDLYEDMITGLTNIYDKVQAAAEAAQTAAAKFGQNFKDDQIIYIMGSGASAKVAYSTSMFLMSEMQWIDSAGYNTGEYFHGPFELTEKDKPYVLFMSDGATRPMDARALTFLQRFDAKVEVVDAKDYGLAEAVPASVVTYFNPIMHTAVFRAFAEQLSEARQHPLTKRRYMWKLSY